MLLSAGTEVPKDQAEANKYFERAAAQGNTNAMYCLAMNCIAGHGCPKDLVRARSLLEVGAARGNTSAAKVLQTLAPG
jgi:TPR repeat protein